MYVHVLTVSTLAGSDQDAWPFLLTVYTRTHVCIIRNARTRETIVTRSVSYISRASYRSRVFSKSIRNFPKRETPPIFCQYLEEFFRYRQTDTYFPTWGIETIFCFLFFSYFLTLETTKANSHSFLPFWKFYIHAYAIIQTK